MGRVRGGVVVLGTERVGALLLWGERERGRGRERERERERERGARLVRGVGVGSGGCEEP